MADWEIQSSLRLVRSGEKLFGPGIASLLEGIQRSGSLRQSALEMGMSYSKAWKVVQQCEQQLGFPLMVRQTGGAHGGGAQLTQRGTQLLTQYRQFRQEASQLLDQLGQRYFGEVLRDV